MSSLWLALDLDGTLISCEERQTGLLAELLGEVGLPLEIAGQAWLRKREGASTSAALQSLGLAPPLASSLASRWVEAIEEEAWLLYDRLLPGVLGVLERLHSEGFKLALVTGRRDGDALEDQLRHLDLRRRFDALHRVSPLDALHAKAAVFTALQPRAAIGDTEIDAQAAASASIPFAAVSTGQRSEAFLRRQGISAVYPSLATACRGLEL